LMSMTRCRGSSLLLTHRHQLVNRRQLSRSTSSSSHSLVHLAGRPIRLVCVTWVLTLSRADVEKYATIQSSQAQIERHSPAKVTPESQSHVRGGNFIRMSRICIYIG